jgi:hypothetical protein
MATVLLATLAALGALTLLWAVLGLMLCPLGTAGDVTVTLHLRGDADTLEHSLRALRWLHSSGLLEAEVVLEDAGLTETGRERVKRLTTATSLSTNSNLSL